MCIRDRLVGKRTQRFYTFGDTVKVKVKDTNISRRSMDLTLAETTSNVVSALPARGRGRGSVKEKRPRTKAVSYTHLDVYKRQNRGDVRTDK